MKKKTHFKENKWQKYSMEKLPFLPPRYF